MKSDEKPNKSQQTLAFITMFSLYDVDLELFPTDTHSSITLLPVMSTITNTWISNMQPTSITPSLMVTMATTDIVIPAVFNEDYAKILAIWSSVGRPAL